MQVRLPIEGLPGFQNVLELTHGLAAARHGPKIALIDDPLHVLFG